jgi:hypothetical protein
MDQLLSRLMLHGGDTALQPLFARLKNLLGELGDCSGQRLIPGLVSRQSTEVTSTSTTRRSAALTSLFGQARRVRNVAKPLPLLKSAPAQVLYARYARGVCFPAT